MYFLSGSMNFFESTVLSLIISFKVSARQTKNFSEDEVTLSRNMARFGFLYHCFPPELFGIITANFVSVVIREEIRFIEEGLMDKVNNPIKVHFVLNHLK